MNSFLVWQSSNGVTIPWCRMNRFERIRRGVIAFKEAWSRNDVKRSSATDNDESNAPRSRCTRFVRGSVTLENTACILDTRYGSSFFSLLFFTRFQDNTSHRSNVVRWKIPRLTYGWDAPRLSIKFFETEWIKAAINYRVRCQRKFTRECYEPLN